MKKKPVCTVIYACAILLGAVALYAKPAAVVLDLDLKDAAVVQYQGKKAVPLTLYMQLEPGAVIIVKKAATIRLTFLATDSISVIRKPGTYRINAKGKLIPDKKVPVIVAKMDFESTITKYGAKTGGTKGVNDDLPPVCDELEPKVEEIGKQEHLDDYAKSLMIYSIYFNGGCKELAAQEALTIRQLKEEMKGGDK